MLSAGRTPKGSPSRLERQGTGRDKVKEASVSVVQNNKRRELEARRAMGRKFPGGSVAAHPCTPTHEVPSGLGGRDTWTRDGAWGSPAQWPQLKLHAQAERCKVGLRRLSE